MAKAKLTKLQKLNLLRKKAPDIEKEVTSKDSKKEQVGEEKKETLGALEEPKAEITYKKICLNVGSPTFKKIKKLKYLHDISYTDFIISAVKEKLEKDYPKI